MPTRHTTAQAATSSRRPALAVPAPLGLLGPEAFGELPALFRRQRKRYRKALARCQRRVSEEAVHHLRVEARRLLSLLELLSPVLGKSLFRESRSALKKCLDSFDELRDTHVQLFLTAELAGRFSAARLLRKQLRKRERRAEQRSRKRLRRLRSAQRLETALESARRKLKAWQERSPAVDGVRVLESCVAGAFARTCQLLAAVDPGRTATIHRTRIAFKKFRYMVEMLAAWLPFAGPARLAAMHRYQTMMGEIQDCEVFLDAFPKLARKSGIEPGPAERFRQALQQRRDRKIAFYLARSTRLVGFWPGPVRDKKTSRGARRAPA